FGSAGFVTGAGLAGSSGSAEPLATGTLLPIGGAAESLTGTTQETIREYQNEVASVQAQINQLTAQITNNAAFGNNSINHPISITPVGSRTYVGNNNMGGPQLTSITSDAALNPDLVAQSINPLLALPGLEAQRSNLQAQQQAIDIQIRALQQTGSELPLWYVQAMISQGVPGRLAP
ncbi:MAG: hypothetical protein ACYDCQ_13095, partial [Dehalococcoidia bacterium]